MQKISALFFVFLLVNSCGKKNEETAEVETLEILEVEETVLESSLNELNDTQTGIGNSIGSIIVSNLGESQGISITISASNMMPGEHGFHVHETNLLNPLVKDDGSVVIAGMAGGHWDPDNTGKHAGPAGGGHRGDLPYITVDSNGIINTTISNSLIQIEDLNGRSFMIHVNGDNYSDTPPLGGSGARLYGASF